MSLSGTPSGETKDFLLAAYTTSITSPTKANTNEYQVNIVNKNGVKKQDKIIPILDTAFLNASAKL